MLETPKLKDIGFSKGFIWEREFEYIVPLPIDECLNRLKDLAHNMKDRLPRIEDVEEVEKESCQVFIDFSNFRTTTSVMIYFTYLTDTTVRIHGRYGISLFLLSVPFLGVILILAGLWLFYPDYRNRLFFSDVSGLALISMFLWGSMAIVAAIQYFIDRFRASTLIQQAFNITPKSKSSIDGV